MTKKRGKAMTKSKKRNASNASSSRNESAKASSKSLKTKTVKKKSIKKKPIKSGAITKKTVKKKTLKKKLTNKKGSPKKKQHSKKEPINVNKKEHVKVTKKDHVKPSAKSEEVTTEEFFMPSPIHKGKYVIPLGIKFLMGYLIFIASLYIISFLSNIAFPTTILFGQLVTGPRAIVVNIFLLALVLTVVYGLWKRKSYAFDLSIGFFMFSTLNSLLSVTLFEWSNHPFKKLMLLSFASLVLVNIVIIWYILKEKKYFFAKYFRDKDVQHTDKVFLYTLISFWIVALLIGATLGLQYYQQTKIQIDSTVKEMKGDYYGRGEYICSIKTGEDKDICNLVRVLGMQEYKVSPVKLRSICEDMNSDFYRFVCLRSAG